MSVNIRKATSRFEQGHLPFFCILPKVLGDLVARD